MARKQRNMTSKVPPNPVIVDAKSAVDLATRQSYSENVFLFVPNLIGLYYGSTSSIRSSSLTSAPGYTRVILAGLSMHFMNYHPKYCTLAYCVSCLLDAADGHAARALNQTSKFGAVLDMVTDRCVKMPLRVFASIQLRLDVQHPVSFATCLPCILRMQSCSNFSSP